MKDIRIACTSDWHLGNADSSAYPTPEQIQKSLEETYAQGIDALLFAGDFVNQGGVTMAHVAANLLKPYIEKGLPVIGIVGNHDYHDGNADEVTKILAASGVAMLEGNSYTIKNKTGDRSVTVVGVSGEMGPEYDSWWRENGWSEEGREKTRQAAERHRNALDVNLSQASSDSILVLTHRSIVPDTIGTDARQKRYVSAQTDGFADIIDWHAVGKNIAVVHGHDHGEFPWEGYPDAVTRGGVAISNVAAPLRMRLGRPLVKILTV